MVSLVIDPVKSGFAPPHQDPHLHDNQWTITNRHRKPNSRTNKQKRECVPVFDSTRTVLQERGLKERERKRERERERREKRERQEEEEEKEEERE